MANNSIDRRVALGLNSSQRGALGKLRLHMIQSLNPRYPACCETHPTVVWGSWLQISAEEVFFFFTIFVLMEQLFETGRL